VRRRPDLARKTWVGGPIFPACHGLFLQGPERLSAGYIERIWNLEALSGIEVWGMPAGEPGRAVAFGMYWSGVFEHFTWTRSARP